MLSAKTRVCLAFPVYNEETILEKSLRILYAFCVSTLNDVDWEIVITDNGSTDASEAIGRRLAGELPHVSYERLPMPGRGGALRTVWGSRNADISLYMDSDLATDLRHIRELIDAILLHDFDIAIGSRLIRGAKTSRSLIREICSRIYGIVPRLFFPTLPLHDCQCGFKAISQKTLHDIVPSVKDKHWFFDTELLIRAHHLGYRITEIPVDWREQRHTKRKSKVKLFETALGNIQKLVRLKKELF